MVLIEPEPIGDGWLFFLESEPAWVLGRGELFLSDSARITFYRDDAWIQDIVEPLEQGGERIEDIELINKL
jgi:hypothetical protein